MSDTKVQIPDEIASLSFEAALTALEDIVGKLESGDVGLEESIETYTRGTQLRDHCDAKLADAHARIEKINIATDSSDGASASGVEPFEVD